MSEISEFSDFSSCSIEIVNYNFPPLDEFLLLLNELKISSFNDELKTTVYTKFKEITNRLLSGRALDDDVVERTLGYFKKCNQAGLPIDFFQSSPKRLLKIVKDYFEIKVILQAAIEAVIKKSPHDYIFVFCSDDKDWDVITSALSSENAEKVRRINRHTIRHKYINHSLLIFGPAYWFSEFLSFPCAEQIFIVQPNGFSTHKVIKRDIFSGPNNANNLWTANKTNISITNMQIDVHPLKGYEKDRPKEIDAITQTTLYSDIISVRSSIDSCEVIDKDGFIKYVQLNKNYLTISLDGRLGSSVFSGEETFEDIGYIVSDIDYEDMTHEDVDNELKSQMERWKTPLREYGLNQGLVNQLGTLGSIKANIQNVRNWSKKNSIAPMYSQDFIAVLSFSGIGKEEFSYFFKLAKIIRSKSISLGHKKSDISKEIVKKEISSRLSNNFSLPSLLTIGNIKAHIIEPQRNING
jgi:hypothetical protein